MTEYEINGKEYEVDYDLDNRIIKVDVDNNDVEKKRRLVGILDLESGASEARRVKAREASLNQCAEHKHQAGQIHFIPFSLRQVVGSPPSLQIMKRQSRYSVVIQNDIMAHPSRLNSVIARAVDGSKFKLEWYHKNYLDHVYAVSDDSGDILEHYRYSAFGQVTIYNENGQVQNTTQIDNHILWNTRRRDELTGYYMYKFRHYSAELGRWLARDPIEEKGGVNLYGFVGNDGINFWDALGLQSLFIPDEEIECDWNIYIGHGMSDPNGGVNLLPSIIGREIKGRKCIRDRWGFVTCNSGWLNDQLGELAIPGIGDGLGGNGTYSPEDINKLQDKIDELNEQIENDNKNRPNWLDIAPIGPAPAPNQANIWEKLEDGLTQLNIATAAARAECNRKGNCCDTITIKTTCHWEFEGLNLLRLGEGVLNMPRMKGEAHAVYLARLRAEANRKNLNPCNQTIKIDCANIK